MRGYKEKQSRSWSKARRGSTVVFAWSEIRRASRYSRWSHELESVSRWQGCFLGRASCRTDRPCAVYERWGPVRDAYLAFLKQTTLAELTEVAD
jgi:hypothetical protein